MRQFVTRRILLEGSLVVAASVAAGSGRAESELSEAEKIAHADAKYQPTPHGQQRCEICCSSSRLTIAKSSAVPFPPMDGASILRRGRTHTKRRAECETASLVR